MLSRVADSIYWMSRLVERADNVARFVEVNLYLEIDLPDHGAKSWHPLLAATGDDKLFEERYGAPSRQNVIRFLTFDREYPNSILACLRFARENARSVREAIPSELWEHLNGFYQFVRDQSPERMASDELADLYKRIRMESHLFHGIADDIMTHGEAWHFFNMGRLIERADKTSRLIDVKYFTLLPRISDVGSPTDNLQWSAVLRSVSGFEMYRKKHHLLTPPKVVEFLLLDREFPRSALHCLQRAELSLHAISGTPIDEPLLDPEVLLRNLLSEFEYASVEAVLLYGLHEFVDGFQLRLNDIGRGIYETFLQYRSIPESGADPTTAESAKGAPILPTKPGFGGKNGSARPPIRELAGRSQSQTQSQTQS
jgi:uncharacterized alpha-E superfamily protein